MGVAVGLVAAWPAVLLALLFGCSWLERRMLGAQSVVPRRIRRMRGAPPEAVEAMVDNETAQVVAAYWSDAGH